MPRIVAAIVFACAFLTALAAARAEVVITVDKTAQRLSVDVDGAHRYDWPVSTARIGYRTPNGAYRPERLARKWFSRKYDWSPMPWSIFFDEGYAIHGSYEISRLGRPASHGCIRLRPNNAKMPRNVMSPSSRRAGARRLRAAPSWRVAGGPSPVTTMRVSFM